MADRRVVYGGSMRPAQEAPQLMVRYVCPTCEGQSILDAYLGVPFCPKDKTILRGISVILEPRQDTKGTPNRNQNMM